MDPSGGASFPGTSFPGTSFPGASFSGGMNPDQLNDLGRKIMHTMQESHDNRTCGSFPGTSLGFTPDPEASRGSYADDIMDAHRRNMADQRQMSKMMAQERSRREQEDSNRFMREPRGFPAAFKDESQYGPNQNKSGCTIL